MSSPVRVRPQYSVGKTGPERVGCCDTDFRAIVRAEPSAGAVNVVIAAALLLFMGATPESAAMTQLENPRAALAARLAAASIFLVVFNPIPTNVWRSRQLRVQDTRVRPGQEIVPFGQAERPAGARLAAKCRVCAVSAY